MTATPTTENPVALAGRRRALRWVALATLGALSAWFSTNAVATALADDFVFRDGQIAWLTIDVQFGFVAGTLVSAFTNLTERVHARRLFFVAAVFTADRQPGADRQ